MTFDGRYLPLKDADNDSDLIRELAAVCGPDGAVTDRQPVIAVALSGGGANVAFEAGVLEKLLEAGIRPDLLVGASGGALNALALFYNAMGVQNQRIPDNPDDRNTTFISKLWGHLSKNHLGGRYVVAPEDLGPLDKYQRDGLTNPWSLIMGAVMKLLSDNNRSIMKNYKLYQTLYKAGQQVSFDYSDAINDQNKMRPEVQRIINTWYLDRISGAPKFPELIITGTNLTQMCDMLFTLVSEKTFADLLADEWYAIQLLESDPVRKTSYVNYLQNFAKENRDSGKITQEEYEHLLQRPLFMEGKLLLDAVLSSSALPAIFPSTQMTLSDSVGNTKTQYFADGGILNNSPIHVAIAAGATHVISVEVADIGYAKTADFKDETNAKLSMLDTLGRSFFTLLSSATNEDIARSASWNRAICKPGNTVQNKRLVQLYRIGPETKPPMPGVGLVDFNGHYERGKGYATSLQNWMDYGKQRAAGENFWRATLDVYP